MGQRHQKRRRAARHAAHAASAKAAQKAETQKTIAALIAQKAAQAEADKAKRQAAIKANGEAIHELGAIVREVAKLTKLTAARRHPREPHGLRHPPWDDPC